MTKEEAIKIINCYDINFYDLSGEKISAEKLVEAFDMAIEALKERSKGKWVRVGGFVTPGGDPVWKCSVCGKGVHVYGVEASSYGRDIADHQWVACPNCGADMRGE